MAQVIAFENTLVNGMLTGVVHGKRVWVNPQTVIRDLDLMTRGGKRQEQTTFFEEKGLWLINVGCGFVAKQYIIAAKLLAEIEGKVTDTRKMYRQQKPAHPRDEIIALAKLLGHAVRVGKDGMPILSEQDVEKLRAAQALVEQPKQVEAPAEQPVKRGRGRPRKVVQPELVA